ncbi:type IV pilus biogenesis/stability protein PilW [Dyella sp. A6]|uniref:type IV pilus biogenesis/stability protein PilW n=1 Tax=Dyella aluminiiresistens TaxID=3069105 RepID=UPI002E7A196B|nr:type IV pilus biogenesis/stability protein PilW [Dyella sp. A6]
MRLERVLLGLGLCALLGGCVTTGGGPTLPTTSKAQEARNAARVHTELAQHYMQLGDLQSALEKLKLALQFDDNYAPAHTVIAVVYERIKDIPDAEENYRRAVELEPKKGAPNNNLGAFLCRIGKSAEGLPYFKRALADPFYATPDVAWLNDGICRMQLHDVAGAENSFRHAIALNPKNPEALYQMAHAKYLENDAFHASAFLQRYEALGKTSPAALKLGYEIELRLGDMDAARNYNKRLQSRFPDSKQAQALNATASP